MNIFSFFSGAGFLDLGFELQGNFNVVFVNEFHKAFNDVYQYARQQMGIAQPIYGHHVEDITEYTDGKHDEKLTNLTKPVNTSKQTDLTGFRTSACSQAICRIPTNRHNKDDSPHVC